MKINEVKELLEQFDQSSLTEFNFRKDSFDLYMNKNTTAQKLSAVVNEGSSSVLAAFPEVEVAVASETTSEVANTVMAKKSEATQAATNLEEIVSPIVGIVYLKPAPDKGNFKQVGDIVKKGEVVCIIEAMKLMNEITSTVDGVIDAILVENEAIIEYNQPLFTVAKGV